VWGERYDDEEEYSASDDSALSNVNAGHAARQLSSAGRTAGDRSSATDSRRQKTSAVRIATRSPSRRTTIQPQVY